MASTTIGDPGDLVISKEISFEKMLVFSGYPETNSVHTSREVAVAKGLPDAIAQGLQMYAYMCHWLVELFGARWFEGGRLTVAFLGLVVPGDLVSVKGSLEDEQPVDDGVQVTLEVWCENHHGQKVAAGTATLTLPET